MSNYKDIIYECFSSDKDLLDKWHIESGTSLENCTNRTYTDMKQTNLKFHVIYNNEELVGYFGKEVVNDSLFLTGFFIKPKFRTKKFIKEFWDNVNTEFNNKNFYCAIYEKNIPAVNFLKRNGGIEYRKIEELKGIVFMFNQESI